MSSIFSYLSLQFLRLPSFFQTIFPFFQAVEAKDSKNTCAVKLTLPHVDSVILIKLFTTVKTHFEKCTYWSL